MAEKYIFSDKELNNAHLFNFNLYASSLSRIIAQHDTQTPLVIGIHGKWGSGKSSLMRTIQFLLETDTSSINSELIFSSEMIVSISPNLSIFFPSRSVKVILFKSTW